MLESSRILRRFFRIQEWVRKHVFGIRSELLCQDALHNAQAVGYVNCNVLSILRVLDHSPVILDHVISHPEHQLFLFRGKARDSEGKDLFLFDPERFDPAGILLAPVPRGRELFDGNSELLSKKTCGV